VIQKNSIIANPAERMPYLTGNPSIIIKNPADNYADNYAESCSVYIQKQEGGQTEKGHINIEDINKERGV